MNGESAQGSWIGKINQQVKVKNLINFCLKKILNDMMTMQQEYSGTSKTDSKLLFFFENEEAVEASGPPISSTFHQDGVIRTACITQTKPNKSLCRRKTSKVLACVWATDFQGDSDNK